jgi:hypothetical protein
MQKSDLLRLLRQLRLPSTVTLVLALLFVPGLAAQGTNLRFTLFGGGSFLKADRTFPAEGQTYHTAFASGGRAGIRVTLDITKHLGAEGSYSYGTNNLRVADLNGVPPLVRGFGVRDQQIDGDILYFLTASSRRLRPFAAFGVGILRVSPTSEAKATASTEGFIAGPATLSSGNKFDFNYGFGVEDKLVKHFGIRFDLRDYVLAPPRLGAPSGPGSPGAGFFPVTGVVHDVEVTAGIVLYAGR